MKRFLCVLLLLALLPVSALADDPRFSPERLESLFRNGPEEEAGWEDGDGEFGYQKDGGY